MSAWDEDDLRAIDAAQELEIAPVPRNGELRTPTTIWAVRAGDDLYVRAAYGPGTGWYRVARQRPLRQHRRRHHQRAGSRHDASHQSAMTATRRQSPVGVRDSPWDQRASR
jgi:hypothetical protein